MKFLKKMALAVTTAAICCTAVLPTVANAGTTACSHNYQYVGTHTIKLGAYWDHPCDKGTCRVDRIEYYDVMRCENCGDEEIRYVTYRDEHRLCGQ